MESIENAYQKVGLVLKRYLHNIYGYTLKDRICISESFVKDTKHKRPLMQSPFR